MRSFLFTAEGAEGAEVLYQRSRGREIFTYSSP